MSVETNVQPQGSPHSISESLKCILLSLIGLLLSPWLTSLNEKLLGVLVTVLISGVFLSGYLISVYCMSYMIWAGWLSPFKKKDFTKFFLVWPTIVILVPGIPMSIFLLLESMPRWTLLFLAIAILPWLVSSDRKKPKAYWHI